MPPTVELISITSIAKSVDRTSRVGPGVSFKAVMEDDLWRIVCLIGTGTYLSMKATR